MPAGQEPPWHKLLGQGPLGHVSQVWPVDLLRPTAKPESSFCISELLHCSHVCFRGVCVFSRNSIVCPHLLHLYSNIGILTSNEKHCPLLREQQLYEFILL